MKETKLTTALASLSKEELSQFGKFLNSRYFNSSEISIKLFSCLKNFHPNFEDPHLTKEYLFEQLYPGVAFDDKKFRDRFTHEMALLKRFLAVEKYDENSFDFKKNLIVALKEKGLDSLVREELKATEAIIEKMHFKDEIYYLNSYIVKALKREVEDQRISAAQKEQLFQHVQNEIDNVIIFFLIVMLKEYSIITNVARHVNIEGKFKLFEQIMSYISKEEHNYKNITIVNIFYNFFQIYKSGNNESFIFYIKDLLIANRFQLRAAIFNMLFIELYNYCKRRQSHGEKIYGVLGFSLLNDMLEKDVFYKENGMMTAHAYVNLAASGLRENNLEWTENFIEKYKEKVNISDRENAYNYNCAVLHYMKGYGKNYEVKEHHYKNAIFFLNKVKSDDFYYMTRIKNHSLKIFYELGDFEAALFLIDSYYHYLHRNPKIPKHLSQRYFNFVSFLHRLIRLREKPDEFSLKKLKTEITDNNNLEYKGWLLDRIDAF